MVDVLYKYGCFNKYTQQLFTTGKVYFASPDSFNDPFECDPVLSTHNLSRDKYREFLIRKAKENGENSAGAKAKAAHIMKAGLIDQPGTLSKIRQEMKDYYNRAGIYCLSETHDDILMWSHYADNHRGYCIQFEANSRTIVFGAAQKVIYSASYPVADLLEEDNVERLELALLTKYEGWSYEKEWRIIHLSHDENRPAWGLKDYPVNLMKKVILGARMAEDHKQSIESWIGQRREQVLLMQAQLHPSRYALEFT